MSRRLNHEGTITKKNGRDLYQGQIRVTLDDGTRRRRTAYAKTRKGVQQKLRAIRLQQEQGILTLARDESMREYLLRWYKNPDLRPNTIHSRYININRILPHIGGIKCCQSAKVGRIGTRENYCYGEPVLSSLAAEL